MGKYENYDGTGKINAFNDFRNLMWGSMDKIQFSKGYSQYEEAYESFRNMDKEAWDRNFERIEEDQGGWILVIIRRKNEKS